MKSCRKCNKSPNLVTLSQLEERLQNHVQKWIKSKRHISLIETKSTLGKSQSYKVVNENITNVASHSQHQCDQIGQNFATLATFYEALSNG